MDVLEMEALTQGEGPGVFIMRVPGVLSLDKLSYLHKIWANAWSQAGARPAPPLLCLPPGMPVETLGAATLKACGLMRIPESTDGRA